MENFTPYSALLGGSLIGLSASLLLLGTGRIAGISGIVAGVIGPTSDGRLWRMLFLLGLIAGGLIVRAVTADAIPVVVSTSTSELVAAGLLVGFGTRVANGCTSGHGVCGIARLAPRSIVATVTFMLAGAITVHVLRRGFGA